MKQVLRYIALLVVGLHAASAQVSTGTITGYVHDSSDAIIIGAKINITQLATSERRETVTNDRGEFTAPYLRRGDYSVTVSATGFKSQTLTGIVLAVEQTVKLPVMMQPGALEQTIEVSDAAPLVDASTSSLGQVIDNK